VRIFLDTSSLIKLYYIEDGTELLDKIFDQHPIDKIFLSEISLIEFYSAIYKKVRTNNLSLKNANDILTSFNNDKSKYTFVAIDSRLIEISQILLGKYGIKGLRSLDAIQFASVYSIKKIIDGAVSNDKLLNSFLTSEDINVL